MIPAGGKRLRVLYLVSRAEDFGGAERFVVGLATHMPRDRIETWVCSTRHGHDSGLQRLADAGIPHLNLGRDWKWQVHRLGGLAALLRRQRFDVLHAHSFGSNLWGTLIGRACGVPVLIAHEHNWSYSGNPLRAWIDGQVIGRLATRFVAVSEASREGMITLEGVTPSKALVMPTAYIPHLEHPNADIRAELGLDEKVPLVAAAAVLRPEKALDVLLEAHAQLLTRVTDAHLVIAGDGPHRAELEGRIAQLGIGSSVHLLGRRRDVDAILRRVDVGVMSSDWEGMPLFVFECMAAGIPLVATAVGGLPDVVADGETGLLVPPRNPTALARTIEQVLTQERLAARLANAAATRLDQFRIESVAGRFADLYEELAEQRASRGVQRAVVPASSAEGSSPLAYAQADP
jgi:glycosyltransferase involved in cell wall biosynthesis